jgi:hypothetical protein
VTTNNKLIQNRVKFIIQSQLVSTVMVFIQSPKHSCLSVSTNPIDCIAPVTTVHDEASNLRVHGSGRYGAVTRGDLRRSVDRKMAGVSSSCNDHTSKPSASTLTEPTSSSEALDASGPGNIRLPHDHTGISSFDRFRANKDDQADEDEEEEEITTPMKEEFIAASAHAGYHLQDLI